MSTAQRNYSCNEGALRRLLVRQQGLVTRSQALELGMSPSAITRRVISGEWERSLPSVYRFTGIRPSSRQTIRAGLLWAGPDAVASHASAAELWGLEVGRSARVELWTRLRALLESRDDAALEHRLEVKLWRLLRSAGLRPARQHPVRLAAEAYRLDFAWPALRIAVECDGFATHGTRRAFEHDRARRALMVAHGWRIIAVTWQQVTSKPDWVVDTIRRALRSAAAA